MTQPLPIGFEVTLNPKTRRTDSARLLIGGSPITAMQLAPAAIAFCASPAGGVVNGTILHDDGGFSG